MINPFQNFTKKKIGGLLLILVIIVAFGFGGFGGGFNTGNQNNIVKINNKKISTQDFIDYLNGSGLSQKVIKENIDKGIIEELLSTLVSTTLLDLEIEKLNISITEKVLIEKIKNNKNFKDKNGEFKRTLYEKFLLTNNSSAPIFEIRLKNRELQKQLFTYIGGGVKTPEFMINNFYAEKNKKINIDYIELSSLYKKAETFTNKEVKVFINNNIDDLKQDYVDFSYVNINPKNLIGLEEFNQAFFDKIDDIENQISKNIDFEIIVKSLNLTPKSITSYINLDNKKTLENRIYNSRKDKTAVIEENESYFFYKIDNINTRLPSLEDDKFIKQIKNILFQKEKFKFNEVIQKKINENNFNQESFEKLSKKKIEKIKIKSIDDNKKFQKNSIEILYALPINSFMLIADEQANVYLAKIISHEVENITKNSINFDKASIDEAKHNKNIILKSYDLFLNKRYLVVVNEKTLERVKNYFK